jgi:hypothetical protein
MSTCSVVSDWLNFAVLTITMLTVIAYTIITNKLQRTSQSQLIELVRQRQLSIIPALLPELQGGGTTNRLQITNIGNGVAVNIHFDRVIYAPEILKDTFYEMTRPLCWCQC